MTQVICLTGTHNVGISFLDWSLHWLAGHDHVYHWQQGWQPITNNPLTDRNAHGHVRNHVSGLDTTRRTIDELIETPSDFHTIYPVGPAVDDRARELGLDRSVMQDPAKWSRVIDLCDQEYAQIWKHCDYMNCDQVFVATDVSNQVYHAHTLDRAQHAILWESEPRADSFLHMHEQCFAENLQSVVTTWEKREILALNLQWYQTRLGHEHLDFTQPHEWVNCKELWYHGESLLSRLLRNLHIPLDQDRLISWRPVYHDWQRINYEFLQFQYQLDHIVNATVNNWHYPLRNLSFLQEVIIQHQLIYQHGLNIKNWQLEHFPDNTQKLHQLLEPNHHVLRSTA